MLDDMDHVFNTLSGTESLFETGSSSVYNIQGTEGYIEGVLLANGVNLSRITGNEAGFVDSIKSGLKKVYETLKNILKGIKDFFTKSKADSADTVKNSVAEMNTALEKYKKADPKTFEVDKEAIKSLAASMNADYPDLAKSLESVDNLPGIINWYEKAIKELETDAKKTTEAEASLKEADKAVEELSNASNGIKEDAEPDEKSSFKAVMAEKTASAKEKVKKSREKLKEVFSPVSILQKLPASIKKILKSKKVDGTESWEF